MGGLWTDLKRSDAPKSSSMPTHGDLVSSLDSEWSTFSGLVRISSFPINSLISLSSAILLDE